MAHREEDSFIVEADMIRRVPVVGGGAPPWLAAAPGAGIEKTTREKEARQRMRIRISLLSRGNNRYPQRLEQTCPQSESPVT